MIIAIQIAAPLRVWHRHLVDRLRARGHVVRVDLLGDAVMTPLQAALVLAVERWVFGYSARLWAPLASIGTSVSTAAPPDRRLILEGSYGGDDFVARFDGADGVSALTSALLTGTCPLITVSRGETLVLSGLPAIERPSSLSWSLDATLERLITLLCQCVDRDMTQAAPSVAPDPAPRRRPNALVFVARKIAARLSARFVPDQERPDHWQTGYRLDDHATAQRRAWPSRMPTLVAEEDRSRFYADPFPIERHGTHYVFVEEFPYATMKGVISAIHIDADGHASTPQVVLETSTHMSYPFLVEDGDDVFMIPETTQQRRVQLFRADPFPVRWLPDEILLDDIMASDATVIHHEGRFWMFATLSDRDDSTWDQLGLFHASCLRGPWTAHPLNPVLIDAGSARPAGHMWHEDGTLMRVAQDCRAGYGSGLVICRVDKLDETGFSQTIVARLPPPSGCGARGAHTLNRDGRLEVVDIKV